VGRDIDPLHEIGVSIGATGVLFAVMQGLLNEGDEVVVLEPAFDIYAAQIQMAGAVPVYVPLRVNKDPVTGKEHWTLDMAELEAAFSPKTRMVIVNTPHNPTGKVFTLQELQAVADILHKFPDVTAVTDEVYEKLIFDGGQHIRLCSLPGMWDRVVTM
jgi:kynurenine--oxoglutarate transaminase/cysteine-S-conjugate beta-lyase/glutamine--phenylpyruvate transaminase